MKTIVVSGALANKPRNGGNAWTRLNWVLGLQRLGFRVCFVEQIARDACSNASGEAAAFADSTNLEFFQSVMKQFGVLHAALIYGDGEEIHGLARDELCEIVESSALLVNISGHLQWQSLQLRPQRKLYFDDDPGYTQFWDAASEAGARLQGHDFYYTIGTNIGNKSCPIPTGGRDWKTMQPLVVLDQWPVATAQGSTPRAAAMRFTTVASWRGAYGPVRHDGVTYGLKAHEFRRYFEMPRRAAEAGSTAVFEIALDIHAGDARDYGALKEHGWRLAAPRAVAGDPLAFKEYLQDSDAEFSVAQGIYVQTRSGWFSDRSAHYLASGRPALVQETGFSRHLVQGEGLIAFENLEQAIAGAKRIMRDYPVHRQAARRLAETYFDSDKVLGRLLDEIELAP